MRKSKFKSFLITLLVLVTVALMGIAGVKVIQKKKAAMAKIPSAKTYAMVVPVRKAIETDVRLTVPYLAEVQSDTDVDLASKVTSRVEMIVKSGTHVKKGQVLVKLDAGDLLAKKKGLRLKIAEMNNQIKAKNIDLRNLKKIHQHNKRLVDMKAIPRDSYDTEASNITSMSATIEGMKNNVSALAQNIKELDDTLGYTAIKSPMDGVVSKTFIAEGGIASGGKPLLSLSGGNSKQFIVRVSDNIKPSALMFLGKSHPLTSLNSTYNGLNEYSCQTQSDLSAGNRVEVKLIVYTGKTILLPANAVLQLNGKQYVMQVNGDQTTPQQITILAEGSEGLIVKGLKAGDEYVVAKPDILLKLFTGVSIIRADS